jgi:hypothetical protein
MKPSDLTRGWSGRVALVGAALMAAVMLFQIGRQAWQQHVLENYCLTDPTHELCTHGQ